MFIATIDMPDLNNLKQNAPFVKNISSFLNNNKEDKMETKQFEQINQKITELDNCCKTTHTLFTKLNTKLTKQVTNIEKNMATKDDIKKMATKNDISTLIKVIKITNKNMLTKNDLNSIKSDIENNFQTMLNNQLNAITLLLQKQPIV